MQYSSESMLRFHIQLSSPLLQNHAMGRLSSGLEFSSSFFLKVILVSANGRDDQPSTPRPVRSRARLLSFDSRKLGAHYSFAEA